MHRDQSSRKADSPAAERAPASVPVIRFSAVRKSYDGGRSFAVERLDLDVCKGEFLTLLGPSGSGKTTTLMMLAGFERPSHGAIELDGRDITSVPPHQRDIGVVFQNYALFPHMTVLENIRFPLSVRRVSAEEQIERAQRALGMVQLHGVDSRRPGELSGGQQQRVAIARALVFNPRLILMDEPLGALDRVLREQMQVELKHLHRMLGVTVVYVTHDQGEAIALSDRVAVFNKGRIAQIGSAEDLYEKPTSEFVAGFLGENNILPGVLMQSDGETSGVKMGASTLRCRKADLPAQTNVCVAIRPERIHLRKDPSSSSADNVMPATVVDRMYFGDHVKYQVAVANDFSLSVKVPAADDVQADVGRQVHVCIPSRACRIVEREQEANQNERS